MREGMNADKQGGASFVDYGTSDEFIEAQYRKTEFRALYRQIDAADRVGKLMRAIEKDVIPQLVRARLKPVEQTRTSLDPTAADEARVIRFARLLLGHDQDVSASSYVAELRAEGVSVETIYLHLLAPAARHVGTLWDDDLCTFVDVTLALGTLHRLMVDLSGDFRFEHRKLDWSRRVLLVQLVGEAHTFGLRMVAEFFKRAAWSVDMAPSPTEEALGDAVQADWFTVIGFSIACERSLDDLAAKIDIVRRRSCNAAVGILVGGPAFVGHPDYVARVGADAMAIDAVHALLEAERYVLGA